MSQRRLDFLAVESQFVHDINFVELSWTTVHRVYQLVPEFDDLCVNLYDSTTDFIVEKSAQKGLHDTVRMSCHHDMLQVLTLLWIEDSLSGC